MPIRTNRGRAAVYRRLWGFPMRSPSHLVGTVVVVAAILVAAGVLVPRLVGEKQPTSPVTGAAGTTSEQSSPDSTTEPSLDRETLPTRLSEPLVTPTPTQAAPEALAVATQWVEAWVDVPDEDTTEDTGEDAAETWVEGLRPYTTPEFLPQLRTVDPANVTATKVVGEPKARTAYPRSVEVEIATDGPTLLVTVIDTDEGWKVTAYSEAESG
ncbi:hypothetical protein [Saccharomonospora sp. NB11]|jgi:hypothetical protein|uniref:hypothetical protein n=1 Tax=Saccharomonospora sp. NB11 TaxID=1642298 RepID=UPI0018D14493|nr:hypothetical protein [Saccharomonospora sp. NB11]